jgi:hypothetical protein
MEIKAGVQVIDKNGEVKKFIVNREPPDKDLFLTPEDVLEATDEGIKLKIALDESSKNT